MPSRGFVRFCLLRRAATWRRFSSDDGLCRWRVLWWRCGRGFCEGLAASAVAGVLAGALLALMVVATATPEAEAVPEIVRELGVSVEEARILYSALLFGVAVRVGFAMFISWFLAALLWRLLEPRSAAVSASRHAGVLGRRRLPRPRHLPSRSKRRRAGRGNRPRRLAGVPKAERKMGKG